MCKSKIRGATITDTKLHYEGSIGIDREIIDAADILPWEKVQVVNLNNGARLETYVIEEKAGSGSICLKGPAARMGQVGDEVIILTYVRVEEKEARQLQPKVVSLNPQNRID
ncbi:aspartate 1-decarboxylase [Candidatus Zixiibacteriota bacterium]